jgi:(2Fe-2S) ferredoxin
MPEVNEQLQAAVKKIGIGQMTRHVFLCLGPSCCAPEVGQAAWEALKQKIRDAGLSGGENVCQRTKVGCLRICCQGPTMVVYPEGTWYSGMTVDRIERLVQEHLVEGRPIREWMFAEHALGNTVEAPKAEPTESGNITPSSTRSP